MFSIKRFLIKHRMAIREFAVAVLVVLVVIAVSVFLFGATSL